MTTRDTTYTRKVIDRWTIQLPRSYKVCYVFRLDCGHSVNVPASAYHRNRRSCKECRDNAKVTTHT